MTSVYIDCPLDDESRRQHLYNGDLFVYSPSPATEALIGLGRAMLEEAFAPYDPREIHHHLPAEAVAAILAKVKPTFIHHPECKKLIPQIMAERGVTPDKLYFDVPRLRSSYPSHFLTSGIAYAFHPHRDTWYSAPTCQINWWLPIYPLSGDNCMGFFPRYFDEPVANNSEIYNYYEWNAKNRATAAAHVKEDTREQPKPQQVVEGKSMRLAPPPGGMIVFSAAQLHESVANITDVARYSIDFRTVHLDDVQSQAGAKNIDNRSTGTTMRDYLRATDLSKLPDEAIARYDDGTERGNRVLYFGDRLVGKAG